MAKVQIKALDSFSHGRLAAVPGGQYTINAGDADELEKAGLVKIIGDGAEDDIDELVGSKMEPITSNKMEPKAKNKGEK